MVDDHQFAGPLGRPGQHAEPVDAARVEGDHQLRPVRVVLRRAEQAEAGQETEDLRDLERLVPERRDDPLRPPPGRAQRVRQRQHGAERVRVRPDMAGQADLSRPGQQGRNLSLRRGELSHVAEYPAP